MMGVLLSILAGILVAMQSVFNTRLGDKIGFWESNTFVHGSGFIFALILLMLFGNGSLKKIGEADKIYLLGGVFGVLIIFSVMKGISLLGATVSISMLLITQLIVATFIDCNGLFGCTKIDFDITKLLGVLVMIVGIVIFKWKG